MFHTEYFVSARMMAKGIDKLCGCCETSKGGIPAGAVWWESFAALGRKQSETKIAPIAVFIDNKY